MSERGGELAVRLERQISELAGVLSALPESGLRMASPDPKAPTAGHLLDHLVTGTALVVTWINGLSKAGNGTGHGIPQHGHAHGHGAGQQEHQAVSGRGMLAAFRSGTDEFVAIVRNLSDDQLDSYPPATPELTDGTRTLSEVIDFIIDDLAGHLGYLNQALAARDGSAAGAR